MNLDRIVILSLVVLAGVKGQSEEDEQPSDEDNFALNGVVGGMEKFGKTFYYLLSDSKPKPNNFVFSPLSITTLLAMLQKGSTSTRKDELSGTLGLRTMSEAQITEGFSDLLQSLPENDDINYKSVERIYVPVSYQIRTKFRESMEEDFSAPNAIRGMDFAKSVTSAEKINLWFSQQTKGKLSTVISEDSISKDTKLVVISAVYFRGRWENPFTLLTPDRSPDQLDFFYLNDTHAVANVTFMSQQAPLKYVNLPDMRSEAVAIPLSGERLEMVILVPKNRDGFEFPLEEQFRHENRTLTSILAQMKARRVQLFLPKFDEESFWTFTHSDTRSINMIRKLGLSIDPASRTLLDYNGITPFPGLYLDKIVHKVLFSMTHKGTQDRLEQEPNKDYIQVRADRPFVYFIRDTETEAILLMGRKTV